MKKSIQRGLTLAATSCLAAVANAAPVPLDTEQKANMAAGMGPRVTNTVPRTYSWLVDSARGIAYHALRTLNATTTPADVLAAPGGLSFPCGTSGTLHARLSQKLPRVLKLTWQACKYSDIDGYAHQRDGYAEITLFEDSFSPARVATVKLGERQSDLIDTRLIVDEEQITDEKRSWNIRLRGDIPLTRAFPPYGLYIGAFNFETTGFHRVDYAAELPGTGLPLFYSAESVTAENLRSRGSLSYDETWNHMTSDLGLLWGDLSSYSEYQGSTRSHGFSPSQLRIHVEEDWPAFRREARIDGAVQVRNPSPSSGYTAGCVDGLYTFKTTAPLVGPYSDGGQYASGAFEVNRSAKVNFYSAANVPPSLPVPQQGLLTRLKVSGLGQFLYDSPSAAILNLNGQCTW